MNTRLLLGIIVALLCSHSFLQAQNQSCKFSRSDDSFNDYYTVRPDNQGFVFTVKAKNSLTLKGFRPPIIYLKNRTTPVYDTVPMYIYIREGIHHHKSSLDFSKWEFLCVDTVISKKGEATVLKSNIDLYMKPGVSHSFYITVKDGYDLPGREEYRRNTTFIADENIYITGGQGVDFPMKNPEYWDWTFSGYVNYCLPDCTEDIISYADTGCSKQVDYIVNKNYNDSIYQIEGLASGEQFPVGVTNNTWVRVDKNGNADTCSFTVSVKKPEYAYLKDTTIYIPFDQCSINLDSNWYSDMKYKGEWFSGPQAGDKLNLGAFQTKWLIPNSCNSIDTAIFDVSVIKQTSFLPKDTVITINQDDFGEIFYYDLGLTVSPEANLISGLPSGAFFPLGTTQNMWQIKDACGIVDTIEFYVIIKHEKCLITEFESVNQDFQNNIIRLIHIPEDTYIDSLRVFLNLEHQLLSDLEIILRAPDGTELYLIKQYQSGLSGKDLENTIFSDNGYPMKWSIGPYSMEVKPHQALRNLRSKKAGPGNWLLKIYDKTDNDFTGKLINWGIEIEEMKYGITSVKNVSCNEVNNGEIQLQCAHDEIYYSIDGSNYAHTNLFQNLFPGTYPIFMAWNGDTSLIDQVTISKERDFDLGINSCFSTQGQQLFIDTLKSGQTPYSISIDDSAFKPFNSAELILDEGHHKIRVMDTKHCSLPIKEIIIDSNTVIPTLDLQTVDASCFDQADGYIVQNNTPKYSISTNPFRGWQSNYIINLAPSNYPIFIKDSLRCIILTDSAIIKSPEPIDFTVSSTFTSNRKGQIHFSASGGTPPYQYGYAMNNSWNTTNSETVNYLEEGSYTVAVKDINGCSDTSQIEIEAISVGEKDSPMIQTYPNPNQGDFKLHLDHLHGDIEIVIINTNGILILSKNVSISSSPYTVELNNIPSGIYSILINSDIGSFRGKLVVL